jgi:hypothetical protein
MVIETPTNIESDLFSMRNRTNYLSKGGARAWTAIAALFIASLVVAGMSQQQTPAPSPPEPGSDGQHDFDAQIGKFKTHVRRRLEILADSDRWAEYEGVSTVHSLWHGRANIVELEADGKHGHLQFLSLRLYNPKTHQWSLNAVNSSVGVLDTPTVGAFRNGRGEFYDREDFKGRPIVVRFVITRKSSDAFHFEQAFSADSGKTWEVNWIADDARMPE